MTKTNFANGQLRQILDRILRLKAEQDSLSADIREVYKEAHGNGFDKTIIGLAVTRLRKEEKNGTARVEETDGMLDIYLSVYRGGRDETPVDKVPEIRHARPHPREEEISLPPHDPETGEIGDTETVVEFHTEISKEEAEKYLAAHAMDGIGDLPAFLDRRRARAEAAP